MKTKKVKFRNYKEYPQSIMPGCHHRDEYDDMPDGAFFQIARDNGVYDSLVAMAEWEAENTYHPKKEEGKE